MDWARDIAGASGRSSSEEGLDVCEASRRASGVLSGAGLATVCCREVYGGSESSSSDRIPGAASRRGQLSHSGSARAARGAGIYASSGIPGLAPGNGDSAFFASEVEVLRGFRKRSRKRSRRDSGLQTKPRGRLLSSRKPSLRNGVLALVCASAAVSDVPRSVFVSAEKAEEVGLRPTEVSVCVSNFSVGESTRFPTAAQLESAAGHNYVCALYTQRRTCFRISNCVNAGRRTQDTCVDDLEFIDSTGWTCLDWRPESCKHGGEWYGFSPEEMVEVRQRCKRGTTRTLGLDPGFPTSDESRLDLSTARQDSWFSSFSALTMTNIVCGSRSAIFELETIFDRPFILVIDSAVGGRILKPVFSPQRAAAGRHAATT